MRILLINRFWGDPRVPSGRMLGDLGRRLVEDGHEVVVLATANAYAEEKKTARPVTVDRSAYFSSPVAPASCIRNPPLGVEERNAHRSTVRGQIVRFIRVPAFGPRVIQWAAFWAAAMIFPLFMRWDRCVVLTDPPFMNWSAVLDRLLRGPRRRRYWWVMDLYPDAVCAAGLLREGGPADRLLRTLNERSLRALDGVVALDDAQRARLARYSHWRGDFSIVVPPWDHRPLAAPAGRNRFREAAGLEGRRVILYAGNLGRAHVFEPIVEAARQAAGSGPAEWTFVFVCRGRKRPALERAASGLENVRVLDYLPADAAADLLFAADVHVITLDDAWTGVSVPSKLYGVLPTGRPVLFLGSEESGTAREIRRLGAGEVLPAAASASRVVSALGELLARPASSAAPPDLSGAERIARFIAS